MRLFSVLAAGLICFALASSATAQSKTEASTLPKDLIEDTRWKNRLLVTCDLSDQEGDGFLSGAEVTDHFQAWPNWQPYYERDMIFVYLFSDKTAAAIPVIYEGEYRLAQQFYEADRLMLIQQAGCQFGKKSYTLIGKDGGVKKKWTTVPTHDDVFGLIDAMPMRQQEMRQQKLREKTE